MKRNIITISILAVAMAFAGCEQKAVTDHAPYYYEVNAAAQSELTKTFYEDNMTFNWSEGDQISVLFNNGTDNKFFTLTAGNINGGSATFGGYIDAGYQPGSSEDGKNWALYPAGDHKYVGAAGGNYPVLFNIPAETDYTSTHFSTNLPMAAVSDASGDIFFYPASGLFKFTFKGIQCSKVKFTVEQQNKQRALNGDFKMKAGGHTGGAYTNNEWADIGSPKGKLTYIENVTKGKAEFYVPFCAWDNNFQPIITLTDADTDGVIYTATAKQPFSGNMGPLLTHMVIVPEITVGAAQEWEFPSKHGINWNSVTAEALGDTEAGYDAIVRMKATADTDKLYVYLEVKKSGLFDDSTYQYSNYSYLCIGNGTGEKKDWMWDDPYLHKFTSWMKYKNAPRYINWNAGFDSADASVVEHQDLYCYEFAIARASYEALQGSSCTLALSINKQYVAKVDGAEQWFGEETQVGFCPARWTPALAVTLP